MGKEIARYKDYSEETAKKIDNAVRRLLDDAKKRAIELLSIHRKQLDVLSAALLEYETLSDAEIRVLLRVEPVRERSDFVSETGFTLDDDIKKRKQKRKTSSSSKAKPKEKELQGNLLFSQEDEVANTKKTEKSKTSRSSDVSNSSHE